MIHKTETAAFELVIRLSQEGQLSISGPIDQRGLCYQMLELAREIIFTRGLEARYGFEPKKTNIVIPEIKFPKNIGKN